MGPDVLPAILGALVGGLFTLLLTWEVRSYQLRESESRADPSLNIDVGARVLKTGGADCILEIRVSVKNNSRKTYCIPAVYVSTRALVSSEMKESYTSECDFGKMKDCGKLSEVRNVARMEHTVLQVAPDEIERFVRWDILDSEFVKQHRVVVVSVEAFSASADLIGEQRYKYRQGKYRLDWIKFMNEDGGVRNDYIPFARWPTSGCEQGDWLKPGRRYLRLPGDGGPDSINSRKFARVLSTMVKWNRHLTVSLDVY